MNVTYAVVARDAMLNALSALLDTGGPGTLELYTDPKPPTPETAITTQQSVGTFTFSADSFADSAGAVLTANSISSEADAAAGNPTWGRFRNGAGTALIDSDAGVPLSNAGIRVSGADDASGIIVIEAGMVLQATVGTINMPGSVTT